MQFINMRPAVTMVMEDGTLELIRRPETLDYLRQVEQIPEKLRP
jgi:hypothetical protein